MKYVRLPAATLPENNSSPCRWSVKFPSIRYCPPLAVSRELSAVIIRSTNSTILSCRALTSLRNMGSVPRRYMSREFQ
jgi:hypothetical protein